MMEDEPDDDLPFPDRPRLRYIDERFRPNLFNISKRYTLAILVNLAFIILFITRSNICLYKKDYINPKNETSTTADNIEFKVDLCFLGPFILIQLPAGIMSYKYQGTRIFGLCVLLSSVVTFLTPALETLSRSNLYWTGLLQGVFQGAAIPSSHSVWRHWGAPLERSTLATLAYSGTYIGVFLGAEISQGLCLIMSWKWMLYIYGLLGILWYLIWLWLVFELPAQHPTISDAEIVYLKRSLGNTTKPAPIPWKSIFSSGPVYAIFSAYIIRSMNTYYVMQADFETYNYVPPFGHEYILALPNLIMAIGIPSVGFLTDTILRRTTISVTNLRKIFISGSFLVQGLWLLLGGWLDSIDHQHYLWVCYILESVMYTLALSNYFVNHHDIAPRYACVIVAISNFLGSTVGMFTLVHEGPFFKINGDVRTVVFVISGCVYILGAVFYGIMGSGEIQPWAKITEADNTDDQNVRKPLYSVN